MKSSRAPLNSSAAGKRSEAARPTPIAAAAAGGGSGAGPVQPPKKRGRPFKQKFLTILRDDEPVKLKPEPEPAPAPAAISARPARRVKAEVKYRNTDSEHSSDRDFDDFATAKTDDDNDDNDADDDDDDAAAARRRKKPAPGKRKSSTAVRTPPATQSSPGTIHQCELCPVKFKRMGWLKVHMQKHHNLPASSGQSPAAASTPPNASASQNRPTAAAASRETSSYSGSSGGGKHHANILQSSGSQSHECRPCGLHFNRLSALHQHQRIAHTFVAGSAAPEPSSNTTGGAFAFASATSAPSTPVLDPFSEILAVKAYFDSINPQHSTAIAAQLEQMFKQTNKQMQWLKRQTTLPTLEDFAAVDDLQREMLGKQLRLYDTCAQLIAAKRDSLQFAYDDWAQKHGGYDYGEYGDGEEEEEEVEPEEMEQVVVGGGGGGGALGQRGWAGGRSGSGSKLLELCRAERMNGHRSYAGQTATAAANGQMDVKPQLDAGGAVVALATEMRITDGAEFEFLDSKTGKLFSNKEDEVVVKAEPAEEQATEEDVQDDGDDDDVDDDLVELIEVAEEEEEEEDL